MNSNGSGLPPRLPIRVRPVVGESVESYIRRLARANHLRPSLLQIHVRSPASPSGSVVIERLAAISHSTVDALTRTLTGLPRPRHQPTTSRTPSQPNETPQATRKQLLFATIRAEAAQGFSIRQISERHQTHRRMVRQALHSPTPAPRRKPATRPAPALSSVKDALDTMIGKDLTIWEIWTRLIDEHDAEASYSTVRDYIKNRTTGQNE
ncbi:TniQ family protein [Umezawaea sp. Da 62-37]|uniref:TniQ family protein n=1 Tax=Umezawaea sp. Da 62-37 TaxID=3075927 RepID=UPI0028F71509|nr:TniQ family protein [Umezawaea sp. Da 62-37]WNV83033.1 TniQ family protein [Umezawaea sp. Da 62-37]